MERNLVVFRHAETKGHAPSGKDIDRELKPRGIEAIRFLCKHWPSPIPTADLLISSPAKRARQTADGLAKELGIPSQRIRIMERLYLASPETIEACLYAIGSEVKTVYLIGHNPGISQWVHSWHLPIILPILPCMGMVGIRFQADDWNQFPQANKSLTHCDFPKKHP